MGFSGVVQTLHNASVAREAVGFEGDRMRIRFDRFDIPAYRLFLKCKALPEMEVLYHRETETYSITAPARFASLLGVPAPAAAGPALPMCDRLFEDQSYLVSLALVSKRFAIWSQCGNGKTLIGLEWARQVWRRTLGKVLIVTLNEVVPEWLEQSEQFYGMDLPILWLESRKEMREWCAAGGGGIAIVNYEKFNPGELDDQVVNECRHLAGVVLDEASRLKSGGGVQKWALIKSCRGIEYKLTLTATPAPNDIMEFASQASFLEKMRSENDIIWTFFTRDPQTQKWTVRPHARKAFFEWMASWSIYVNNPKRYGWRLDQPDVPVPTYITVPIKLTREQADATRALNVQKAVEGQIDLFANASNGVTNRTKLSQIAKGFRYRKGTKPERILSYKPDAVAKIVEKELYQRNAQVLVWTVFDEEVQVLRESFFHVDDTSVAYLTGETPEEERVRILEEFRRGGIRVLVSRAGMLGFGKNFQFCSAMVFSGWTDSFEYFYQAVRRAVRYGQKESVRIYLPVVRELEGDVFDNIRRKEAEFERSISEMEEAYVAARRRLGGIA